MIMNKKFSTLVGCLLAGTAFSTAVVAGEFDRPIEYRNTYVGAGITSPTATVNHIEEGQWYQLRTTFRDGSGEDVTGVLVHERDKQTGEVLLRVRIEGNAPLLPSLWRIEYTGKDGVGGGKYQFVNKETNISISFDHVFSAYKDKDGQEITPAESKLIMGDCSLNWEWYNNNKQTAKFAEVAPYAYLHSDASSVMVLKMDDSGYVYSFKGKASNILQDRNVASSVGALAFQPVIAKDITLSAQDFNSMIDFNKGSWDQLAKFSFFEPNGDLLNAKKMSPKTSGVMQENQNYKALYDNKALVKIFADAAKDLGGVDNMDDLEKLTLAVTNASEAVSTAESNLETLNNKKAEKENSQAVAKTWLSTVQERYHKLMNEWAADALLRANEDAEAAAEYLAGLDTKELTIKDNQGNTESVVMMNYISKTTDFDDLKKAADQANKAWNAAKGKSLVEKMQTAMDLRMAVNKLISTLEISDDAFKGQVVRRKTFEESFNTYVTTFSNAIKNYTEEDVINLKNAQTDATQMADLEKDIQDLEKEIAGFATQIAAAEKELTAAVEALKTAEAAMSTAQSAWEQTKYIVQQGFMRLNYVDGVKNDKYLMVDTAFWQTNTQGQAIPSRSDLKIAHNTLNPKNSSAIDARFFFKLTYFPTQDSLVVEPLNASVISNEEYAAKKTWKESYVGEHFAYKANVGVNAEAASNSWTTDKSPVALKLEELSTSDWCLTAAAVNPEFDSYLKTRIAFNNPYGYLVRTTLPEGLYHIKATNKGKYVVANFEGRFMYDVEEENIQNYDDMPATMFVVKKAGCKEGDRVAIYNREFGYEGYPSFIGQLYKDEKGNLFTINHRDYPREVSDWWSNLAYADNYVFEPVTDKDALTNDRHGYKRIDPETLKYTSYSLNYNWSLNDNLYLNTDKNGLLAYSEGATTTFELDTVIADLKWKYPAEEFGYGAGVADLKQLKRNLYTLKVSDANLIDNDTTYVALVKEEGKNEYYRALGINEIRNGKGQLAVFYLKADQRNSKDEKAYVLIDARQGAYVQTGGIRQANCVDGNQRLSHVDLNNEPNERASAFALKVNNRPLYKTIEAAQNVNIFRTIGTTKQFLFEDCGNKINVPNAKKGFGFLGLTQEDIKPGEGYTTALYVDEVLSSNARMPQYMFVVDVDSVDNGKWCNDHGYNPGCEHEVYYNGYLAGRFLVNLTDSITKGTNLETNADMYKYQSFTRLGFVEGVHMYIDKDEAKAMNKAAGEYFYTLLDGVTLADLKDENGKIIPNKLFDAKLAKEHKIESGKHNNYSFSLRLKNDTEEGFFLESNKEGVSSIGSFKGAWVKEMNGVLVLAQSGSASGDHDQNAGSIEEIVNQAQYFQMEETSEEATANEDITTSSIQVITTNGAIIVKGAAGKNVAISNVLGQTIANTVATSDEATIAVPTGVVIVTVEGEAAVKAIVK